MIESKGENQTVKYMVWKSLSLVFFFFLFIFGKDTTNQKYIEDTSIKKKKEQQKFKQGKLV